MQGTCIHFGQFSPYLTWAHVCGFIINGVPQTMYGWGETKINAGTVMKPFVGFYTDIDNLHPECSGSSNIKISLINANSGATLSTTTLDAFPDTQYIDWWMPSIQMPSEDINLKFQIHIMSGGSYSLATETNSFYIRVVQCNIGETKCEENYLWNCESGRWINTYQQCETNEECASGETKCVGDRRYNCVGGKWVDSGYDQTCQTQTQCNAATELYKCEDCRLYKCVGGQWTYVQDKPILEDLKYCGFACNKYIIFGIAAVGIITAGAIAYLLVSRRSER